MSETITDLSEGFTQPGMDRRSFLDHMARTVGGSAAAFALVPIGQQAPAQAQAPVVAENDARLAAERIQYDAAGTKMAGYLARLKGARKRPAVIVIHENRGLNPHIQDVARRVAVEGFLALAPDMLSPLGGTPAGSDQATKMFGSLKTEESVAELAATVRFLASHPESTGKVGVVGFCWGGGMVNSLAAAGTSLNAAVAYYGRQIPAADVPKITAPLMLHYASLDERINAGIPEFEAALKANKKAYELYMYEGANHAFNNDTNPQRYHKEAATLAWSRTMAFFKKYLGT